MKRNLLLLAVMLVAILFYPSHSQAQCPQDPIDLGYCDTLYVETFDCDHTWEATAGYDSVRVAIFVTHDSNTFYWEGGARWVQDSISAFVIPLCFRTNAWHNGVTCDDVKAIIPQWDQWNNLKQDPGHALFPRSIFRHLKDYHPPYDTTFNKIATMVGPPEYIEPWTMTVDIDTLNHYFFNATPVGTKRWSEGYKELLFTITFLVSGLDDDCDSMEICLDSCFWPPQSNLAFTRYDAVNYVPRGANPTGEFLEVCDTIFIIPNEPPICDTVPDDAIHHINGTYASTRFSNFDPDGEVVSVNADVTPSGQGITGVTVILDSPPPAQRVSGYVEYDVVEHCLTGDYEICIECMDDLGAKDLCCFIVTLENYPPEITQCPEDDTCKTYYAEGMTWCSTPFAGTDPDNDPLAWSVYSTPPPTPPGVFSIVGDKVCWNVQQADTCILYTVTLVLDDVGQPTKDSCQFLVHIHPPPPLLNKVEIPNIVYQRYGIDHWGHADTVIQEPECWPYPSGVNPGDFFEIPIFLKGFLVPVGGFELEVEFDYIDLTFYGANPGDLLTARWMTGSAPYDTLWSWEYFTYRVLPCPLCACCKYKILFYGQAEMPDGAYNRGYCLTFPNLDPNITGQDIFPEKDLLWMKFQVANNELLRDLKIPIIFEWEHKYGPDTPLVIVDDWDCAENTMSNCEGTLLYVSKNPLQYNPDVCPYDTGQHPPDLILDFNDGGVHICSPCTAFKCVRGDINLDHVAYTTADAVLFARYFVYGLSVFYPEPERSEQICATDVNADGRTLMLSDLIYLIRVIQRDATPFPKLGPSSDVANLIVSDGKITVECASPVGGILFVFDGAVTPTLLNTDMELIAHEGNVLVWSSAGNSINAGASEVLTVAGAQLVSVTAVDREGRDLATTITAKVAPSAFALHHAYPNPFNPYTNLSFTLPNATAYSMKIYNVAGQLVRSYEGMGEVGLNVITWDGKDRAGNDVSSGVYFYKLTADNYTATEKMVMMK